MIEEDLMEKHGHGILAPVISSLSFICGLVRILLEEVNGMVPIFSIVKLLASVLDPIMAIWIAVIMIAGYWLKRTRRPPWLPSLPVLLLALYLVIGFIFGWMQNTLEGWKGVAYVLVYGIGNGFFFTGFSFIIYDIAHGAIKKSKAKKTEVTTE